MEDKEKLTEKELEKVVGGFLGMTNPVSKLTETEMKKIVQMLGAGTDMGSWSTMSGEQFMEWWEKCHKGSKNIGGENTDQMLIENDGKPAEVR